MQQSFLKFLQKIMFIRKNYMKKIYWVKNFIKINHLNSPDKAI